MSELQIIVAKEGFVFVGDVAREGDHVVIRRAKNVRRWGTSKGLGQLRGGPLTNTVLDPSGVVRVHVLNVVAQLEDLDEKKWNKALGAPPEIVEPRDPHKNVELVIAGRGWVFVGAVAREGDGLAIYQAQNLRRWNTSAGLGAAAINGPENCTLDDYGFARVHVLAATATIDCSARAWSSTLEASRAKRGSS